ncbi:MAG: hypothetical protein V1698_00700 [bacterium]
MKKEVKKNEIMKVPVRPFVGLGGAGKQTHEPNYKSPRPNAAPIYRQPFFNKQ